MANVRARTMCDLFSLSQRDFKTALVNYPDVLQSLKDRIKQMVVDNAAKESSQDGKEAGKATNQQSAVVFFDREGNVFICVLVLCVAGADLAASADMTVVQHHEHDHMVTSKLSMLAADALDELEVEVLAEKVRIDFLN